MSEKPKTTSKTESSGEVVIEIKSLKKSFGTLEVLKDISLQLFNGENLVVLGKSGSGKSVLIKCIVRLLDFDEGTITIFNQNIATLESSALSDIRQKIGFLFQSGALYDSMSVKENLMFPLIRIQKKLTQKQIDEKVEETLDQVGLKDSLEQMPSELSGGMRKRISLARTLVVDPLIMLYDEPTTGLDPITANEISLLINDIQKKYKTSSIIITHDIACARATAHRIIMLNEGKIYKEGNIEAFEKSTDPFIKSFFI